MVRKAHGFVQKVEEAVVFHMFAHEQKDAYMGVHEYDYILDLLDPTS